MIDLVYWLTSLLFSVIRLWYYYNNFDSSIICCLSYGDIYFSFGISVSLSTVSEVFCCDAFLILLAML